ncbi:MAG: hypothetical protein KDA93_06425 [Planctomycetaceae bacterium]|nr:hypothetical protein [Planctomycetaceae bacterium]
MFDLETAIAEWKQSLAAHEAVSSDDVSELEAHLREDATSLTSLGLAEDEAFIIAQHRVGAAATIGAEYAKENQIGVWARRLKWMCLGAMFMQFYKYVVYDLTVSVVYRIIPRTWSDGNMTPVLWITDVVCFGIVLTAGVFIILQNTGRLERVWVELQRRSPAAIVGPIILVFAIPGFLTVVQLYLYRDSYDGMMPRILTLYFAYRLTIPIFLVIAMCLLRRREHAGQPLPPQLND